MTDKSPTPEEVDPETVRLALAWLDKCKVGTGSWQNGKLKVLAKAYRAKESEAATLRERVKELEATYLHTPVGHVIEKLQEEVKKLTAQLNGIKDLKTYLAALKERLKP